MFGLLGIDAEEVEGRAEPFIPPLMWMQEKLLWLLPTCQGGDGELEVLVWEMESPLALKPVLHGLSRHLKAGLFLGQGQGGNSAQILFDHYVVELLKLGDSFGCCMLLYVLLLNDWLLTHY